MTKAWDEIRCTLLNDTVYFVQVLLDSLTAVVSPSVLDTSPIIYPSEHSKFRKIANAAPTQGIITHHITTARIAAATPAKANIEAPGGATRPAAPSSPSPNGRPW